RIVKGCVGGQQHQAEGVEGVFDGAEMTAFVEQGEHQHLVAGAEMKGPQALLNGALGAVELGAGKGQGAGAAVRQKVAAHTQGGQGFHRDGVGAVVLEMAGHCLVTLGILWGGPSLRSSALGVSSTATGTSRAEDMVARSSSLRSLSLRHRA